MGHLGPSVKGPTMRPQAVCHCTDQYDDRRGTNTRRTVRKDNLGRHGQHKLLVLCLVIFCYSILYCLVSHYTFIQSSDENKLYYKYNTVMIAFSYVILFCLPLVN